MKELIKKKYKDQFPSGIININIKYFETLYAKFVDNESVELVMNESGNNANCFPLPILSKAELSTLPIQNYEDLKDYESSRLKDFTLEICKMQAGLGTSVKRLDLLKKYSHRKELGAKGTDLFITYEGKKASIAEVQLLLAEKYITEKIVNKVKFKNLVNSETKKAVEEIWKLKHPQSSDNYATCFNSATLSQEESIDQLMMPTIDNLGQITFEREAPAGHAFLGFYELMQIFSSSNIDSSVLCIGNGEDLKSNPDQKILNWMVDKEIPIAMITTTKLPKDKKGGQIALVKEEAFSYLTIIEKAQAQKANQLNYFEELGLREGDERSLFNTNIVLINKKVLKQKFNSNLKISIEDFSKIIAPELIKNTKEQNGKSFIQLEGAIGSTLLNLDKYFRLNFKENLVHFLNLAPENREKFFLPIKKRADFNEIYGVDVNE